VRFVEGLLPGTGLPAASYDLLISNSLLHHLHDPAVLWEELRRLGRSGAAVLVMDLFRPEDQAAAASIVAAYAADEPEVLRRDFHASLCAAFSPEEVRAQLAAAGLAELAVRTVSDRHLLVHGRLPA
jgi:SAM-dependent methyltransferase